MMQSGEKITFPEHETVSPNKIVIEGAFKTFWRLIQSMKDFQGELMEAKQHMLDDPDNFAETCTENFNIYTIIVIVS